jgi:transcriptional regulator with XRE-family HTH domain
MFKFKTESGKNSLCGENLRKIRKRKKWSQKELAVKLQVAGYDIDHYTISKIELGQSFVIDIELPMFCEVLGVSIFELLPELKKYEKKPD